jgi:hypothetical protein
MLGDKVWCFREKAIPNFVARTLCPVHRGMLSGIEDTYMFIIPIKLFLRNDDGVHTSSNLPGMAMKLLLDPLCIE